jgi:2-polyprenyl-6-methoxyphenol hydroxylase-like FAD-dependent oxidoreductase
MLEENSLVHRISPLLSGTRPGRSRYGVSVNAVVGTGILYSINDSEAWIEGKHLMTLHGDPQSLRVPRAKLCDVLLRELQRDSFFAMPCTGFAEKHGKPVVLFANGHEETADVVVACDGVKSVIRQQLIGDTPHYLGLSALAGTVAASMAHPLLAAGPLLLLGNGASLILDQEQDNIGWSLTMHMRHKELEQLPGTLLKERVLATTQRWYSPIRELVSSTHPEDITYAGGFYDKEPQQHARTGTLVLLGDAAHPVSPFRGKEPIWRWRMPCHSRINFVQLKGVI